MNTLKSARPDPTPRASKTHKFLAAVLAIALPSLVAGAEVKKTFPRLAGIQIGANPYPGSREDPDYHRDIAKLDVAILSQNFSVSSGKAIKAINPDILLGLYTIITEVNFSRPGVYATWRAKLDSEVGPDPVQAPDWWLYTTEGEKAENWPGTHRVNLTDYVKRDENGETWVEYRVRFDNKQWFQDPVWDIWYSDVVRHSPRLRLGKVANYSGGKASRGEENVAYRRAQRLHWDLIYETRPGTIIVANINWWEYQVERGYWDLDIYQDQIQGGLFETAMSKLKGPEKGMGWHAMYDMYRWGIGYLRSPELFLFHAVGEPTDYQWARYAIATCLMADGFLKYSPEGKYHFGTVEWFDEFDLAGASTTSWLGQAVTGSPDEAWQNGVYRRDFEHGIALVNPRRNGPRTVTVEDGFRRIAGSQDPGVNNGQPASQIRLEDGDGILLIREESATLPPPPSAPELRIGS